MAETKEYPLTETKAQSLTETKEYSKDTPLVELLKNLEKEKLKFPEGTFGPMSSLVAKCTIQYQKLLKDSPYFIVEFKQDFPWSFYKIITSKLTVNNIVLLNEPSHDIPTTRIILFDTLIDKINSIIEYGKSDDLVFKIIDTIIDFERALETHREIEGEGEISIIIATDRALNFRVDSKRNATLCNRMNMAYGLQKFMNFIKEKGIEIKYTNEAKTEFKLNLPNKMTAIVNVEAENFLAGIENAFWEISPRVIKTETSPLLSKIKRVTIEELKKKVETTEFIDKVRKTLIEFYKWKIERYDKRFREFDLEITNLELLIITSKLTADERKDMKMMDIKLSRGALELSKITAVKFSDMLRNISNDELRYRFNRLLFDTDKGLNNLIGEQYDEIKTKISTILASLEFGHKIFSSTFQNIVITGPAGVGKTTLATYLAFIFNNAGIIATDIVSVLTRADLVGEYLGQTASKTKRKLLSSLETVVFIDEAYQLGGCPNEDAFGMESITEIVNFLDKYISMNIVIVAGYADKMADCFFSRNEGLARRFPVKYILQKYTGMDLFLMFIKRTYIDLYEYYTVDPMPDLYQIYRTFENLNLKNFFPYQGGDVGNVISGFYNYFYSKNTVIDSFNGALFDLGIGRKDVNRDELIELITDSSK